MTFLDTSGLIGMVSTRDQWHRTALAVWRTLLRSREPLLTTSLVLVEIGDGLSRAGRRSLALQVYETTTRFDRIEVVHVDDALFDRGWSLFRTRPDKEWGLTDCVSMAVMDDRGIDSVFTMDHHFEQAGFRILMP